jgi:S-adenosylmethionine synthetase
MHSSTRHASRTPKPPTASYQWSSEYVSPGHPDKIADQISDAVLDAYLRVDAHARVACETMVKNNVVILAGEVSAMVMLPEEVIETVVRDTIRSIGYRGVSDVFDADTCIVHQYITQQSPEIAAAVQKTDGEGRSTEIAAGDQGIMFGYATRETPTFMPMAIYLAKAFITHAYEVVRQEYPLFPDMKAQVGLTYENGKARRIDSIVFSTCHDPRMSIDDIRAMFNERLLPAVIDAQPHHIRKLFKRDVELLINPAGTWTVGGPVADCGLTGRKIVVDHYGADCEIGGGAFSGKDPTKVDRSAAYMARYLALQALHQHDHVSAVKVQLASYLR